MKTNITLAGILFIFLFNSCKKTNSGPDPIPPVVVKTDSLSAGWKKIILDSSANYADIFFANNTVGYLVGNKAYKTADGGLTWTIISSKRDLANIAATSNGNAFFVKALDDSVYKYVNAGTTFSALRVTGASYGMDVFFTDNNTGYFISMGGLFGTTDGGNSWARIFTPGLNFATNYSTVYFTTANTGWIANTDGIFKTNGNITSWVKAAITGTSPSGYFYSVYATANNTVYVGTSASELLKSTDGGANFSLIKAFNGLGPCDVHFVDNNTGYVSSGNKVYKTTDAGANWSIVVALGEASLVELHFTDANHGWACGSKGTVLLFN